MHLTRVAADRAYETAGVDPRDVGLAELHVASAIAEIVHTENCRSCEYGEGETLAGHDETKLGGRPPINGSGGLYSKGHPFGATGIIQFRDLDVQLRGEGGPAQLDNARICLAENGGAFYGLEEAAYVVTILERP